MKYENNETINLFVRYKGRKLTAKEYIEYTRSILLKLKSFDSIFDNLYGWGTNAEDWTLCDPMDSSFENTILAQIGDEELAYVNENKDDKKLQLNSYSYIGFANSYSNTKKEKDGRITIKISDGLENGFGFINIKFPKIYYPQFYTKKFCRELLLKCFELAPIEYAVVLSDILKTRVSQIEKRYWIGWITYLHCDINDFISPVQIERYTNGMMFYLSKEDYTDTSQEIIEEASFLKDKMMQDLHIMSFFKNILD